MQPPYFFGIDVGGTNTKFGLVDQNGSSIAKGSIPTESERGVPDALLRMATQLERLLKENGIAIDEVVTVGLATPGTMDLAAGMILEPPNLPGWRHFPIRDALQEVVGKPVTYTNDATAAGFGEYWVGSGRNYSSIALLTLGTGVGGGIILGGKTIDGAHDHGSEVGHVPIEFGPQARPCNCGQRGHLEAYCSATALVRRTSELLESGETSSLRQLVGGGQTLTAKGIYDEANAGDAFARRVIWELGEFLAVGITSLAHIVDPEIVLLGGAMHFGGPDCRFGRAFLEHVRSEFRRQTFPVLARATVIDFAQLGGDAGYIGAAGLAREAYDGRKTRFF